MLSSPSGYRISGYVSIRRNDNEMDNRLEFSVYQTVVEKVGNAR